MVGVEVKEAMADGGGTVMLAVLVPGIIRCGMFRGLSKLCMYCWYCRQRDAVVNSHTQ